MTQSFYDLLSIYGTVQYDDYGFREEDKMYTLKLYDRVMELKIKKAEFFNINKNGTTVKFSLDKEENYQQDYLGWKYNNELYLIPYKPNPDSKTINIVLKPPYKKNQHYIEDYNTRIFTGEVNPIKTKPTRKELKEKLSCQSFSAIAREYGVTDTTVKRWARNYELPYLISIIKVMRADGTWSRV